MEGLMFVMLFLAVAIGFILGRRPRRESVDSLDHSRYMEGLRQLINEQHDAALDTLIGALDVNATTFETHLALGAHWRRKGEGNRAILVHQNILGKPGLSALQMHQAQLELALDYSKSGLLDRAEVLLQELTGTPIPEIRRQAFQELVYLYQDEREWEKAIQYVESLSSDARPGELPFWRSLQAHYCCELVEADLVKGIDAASSSDRSSFVSKTLSRALGFMPTHNRALLLQVRFQLSQGDIQSALKTTGFLRMEEPYLMIALPMVIEVYERADRTVELKGLLGEIYLQKGVPALIPVLAQRIYEMRGNFAALEFVQLEVNERDPGFLAGLLGLLDKEAISFSQLKPVLDQALPFVFHCEACGFEGKRFYWCCPTCKHWL